VLNPSSYAVPLPTPPPSTTRSAFSYLSSSIAIHVLTTTQASLYRSAKSNSTFPPALLATPFVHSSPTRGPLFRYIAVSVHGLYGCPGIAIPSLFPHGGRSFYYNVVGHGMSPHIAGMSLT
jgi:hypothetical protein